MLPFNTTISFDVYKVYLDIVSQSTAYLKNVIVYLGLWSLAYFVLCVAIYRRIAAPLKARRVLLVVAHPDDECMFFGPTICGLLKDGVDVHLLCLSAGDYEGKGIVRRKELWDACSHLGIPEQNICLVSDTRLRDDPKAAWPSSVIAKLILHRLEALDVDVLVTFDKVGVSAHPNHSAVFYAVAYMFVQKTLPLKCTVYTLDSVNRLRKYWGYLDMLLSFLLSSHRYFLRWSESKRVVRAMSRHRSQMVWFRKLYVIFSRYMVLNTLKRVHLPDIELELELDFGF